MAEDDAVGDIRRQQPADAAALHFALSSAAGSEEAKTFLRHQSEVAAQQARLIALQADELHEEMQLNLSHLRHRRFGDYTKLAFETAIGLIILLVVCGIATMVWSAMQDRDLVVEAFTVPPDVAASGMTGAVLANRVLDSLGRLESDRRATTEGAVSYRRDRGDEVRVEIPDTGISLGELNRYLRAWLGHEMHAGGDLVRTARGFSLTVRYADAPGVASTGGAGDLDQLIEKSAEHIFAAAQPFRYVEYLTHSKRFAEAAVILPSLVDHGTEEVRARGYADWAEFEFWQGHMYAALEQGREAVRLDPANPIMAAWVGAAEANVGHDELSREYFSHTVSAWHGSAAVAGLNTEFAIQGLDLFTAYADEAIGDFRDALIHWEHVIRARDLRYDLGNAVSDAAAEHDQAAALRFASFIPPKTRSGDPNGDVMGARFSLAWSLGDWPAALSAGREADAILTRQPDQTFAQRVGLWPQLAYAMAQAGDVAGADKLIAKTPLDCDICMRMRGRIAAVKHDWAEASRDFAAVALRSPHTPYAETDWGATLMAEGDFNGAIAKIDIAHAKGPHFADPLEMWGEALMRKNRSDLALAKFEEADRYAPNWGRLHLKWGEALLYAGHGDDSKKQFAIASHLDLDAAAAAALAREKAGHG